MQQDREALTCNDESLTRPSIISGQETELVYSGTHTHAYLLTCSGPTQGNISSSKHELIHIPDAGMFDPTNGTLLSIANDERSMVLHSEASC